MKRVRPRLSRALLLEVAHRVRDRLLPDRDAEGGDCQPVAEALERALRRRGFGAGCRLGNWRGHPHMWVVVENWSIDPTRDQFRYYVEEEEDALLDAPVLVWRGAHPEYGSAW